MVTSLTRSSDSMVEEFVTDSIRKPAQTNYCDPELFSIEEIRQFEADDVEAGRRIGKILATLFVYTLIAMSIVTWWTFRVVQP